MHNNIQYVCLLKWHSDGYEIMLMIYVDDFRTVGDPDASLSFHGRRFGMDFIDFIGSWFYSCHHLPLVNPTRLLQPI